MDFHDIETDSRDLRENDRLQLRYQVSIGCGQNPNVDPARCRAPQRKNFLGFQSSEQFDLEVRRDLADFIEKNGSASGLLEQPFLIGESPRERTFYMAENETFQQRLR